MWVCVVSWLLVMDTDEVGSGAGDLSFLENIFGKKTTTQTTATRNARKSTNSDGDLDF